MSDILVVDDERDIRELVADILEDEGYSTRKAGNSDECMVALNEEVPALLILDIWLKDSQMDGIDILKAVKRQSRSACSDHIGPWQCRNRGGCDQAGCLRFHREAF